MYLPLLKRRHKWFGPEQNLRVEDLVLVNGDFQFHMDGLWPEWSGFSLIIMIRYVGWLLGGVFLLPGSMSGISENYAYWTLPVSVFIFVCFSPSRIKFNVY